MNAEDAFRPTQDRSHFFASSVANAALDQMQQGLDHALPLIVVTGEPGVGKTAVVREACARWGARVRAEWLVPTGPAPDALCPTIVRLFGGIARTEDDRAGWIAALSRALGVIAEKDEMPLLIVDDAHLLAPDMLLELSNIEGAAAAAHRALRMVLVGHSKLEARLDEPALAPVAGRVAVRARVAPMPVADVRTYLHHRLAAAGEDGERVFSRKAARELHAASAGVPSRLDALAAASIRVARDAGMSIVVPEHVQSAVDAERRSGVKTKPPTPRRRATDARPPAAKAVPAAAAPAPPPAPEVARPSQVAANVEPAAQAPAPTPVVAKAEPPVVPAPAAAPAEPAQKPAPVASEPASPAPAAEAAPEPAPPVRASRPAHRRMTEPEVPPFDSRHPRVKEWVSRFTEGQGSNRFSARMELPPITEPETFPLLEPETPEEIPPGFTQQAAGAESSANEPAQEAARQPAVPATSAAEPAAAESAALMPVAPESVVFDMPPDSPPQELVKQIQALSEPRSMPLVEPESEPQLNPRLEEPRLTRRERRQREREALRARPKGSAQGIVPARPAAQHAAPATPISAPPRLAAASVRPVEATVPPAPRPPRKLIIDESVTQSAAQSAPLPQVPGLPTERFNVGPRSPYRGRFLHVVVPGLIMLGVATIAIVAGTRGGFDRDDSHQPTQVSSNPPTAPAAPATPPATPRPAAADTQATAAAPVVIATPADTVPARFCLAVGTYLFSDRARLKARQLEKLTNLNAWVETETTDGTRSYRILVGGFPTQAAAERAADRMLNDNLVTEAMVQPLPATHQ